MSRPTEGYQLVYFPYLGLEPGLEFAFGNLSVWDASQLDDRVPCGPLRSRVTQLLASHRASSGKPGASIPVKGIGVVASGDDDFSPLVPKRLDDLQELRCALFLACLSSDLAAHGPNAGHYIRTAENFSFITQGFVLDSDYISEVSGVILRTTSLGYKIGEVQFPTPSYVPSPLVFRCDTALLLSLDSVRHSHPALFRRLLDAAGLFIESYHNTHAVDVRARVLLQTAAFEVLLELPEGQQRKVFKNRVEEYCAGHGERRFAYKFEVPNGKRSESRTVKGIWADRFYTLRNHIIHGARVRHAEYLFRGKQHHVVIAPVFFVHMVRRLIENATSETGEHVKFYSRITWDEPLPDHDDPDDEPRDIGFRTDVDYYARAVDRLPAGAVL